MAKDDKYSLESILAKSLDTTPQPPLRLDNPKPRRHKASRQVMKEAVELLREANDGKLVPAKITDSNVLEAYRQFEAAVGGRKRLLDILEHCPPTTVGYSMVMKLIKSPEFLQTASSDGDDTRLTHALAGLCRTNRLPLNTLIMAFRDSVLAKKALEALLEIQDSFKPMFAEIARDSKGHWEECHKCEGGGRIQRIGDNGEWARNKDGAILTSLCFECRGKGKTWVAADVAARKTMIDLGGFVKKEPLVQQTIDNRSVNVELASEGGKFERVIKSLDNMIKGKVVEPVIEAEIIDVQPEGNQ